MSWFIEGGWQFWLFTLGIALFFAGLAIVGVIIQDHAKSSEPLQSQKLFRGQEIQPLKRHQANVASQKYQKDDSLSSEVGQEPKTTKKGQGRIDEQKDCQGRVLK